MPLTCARDGGKLIDCFAFFKTIEEILNRYSRASKDRSAAQLAQVYFNGILRIHAANLSQILYLTPTNPCTL